MPLRSCSIQALGFLPSSIMLMPPPTSEFARRGVCNKTPLWRVSYAAITSTCLTFQLARKVKSPKLPMALAQYYQVTGGDAHNEAPFVVALLTLSRFATMKVLYEFTTGCVCLQRMAVYSKGGGAYCR